MEGQAKEIIGKKGSISARERKNDAKRLGQSAARAALAQVHLTLTHAIPLV